MKKKHGNLNKKKNDKDKKYNDNNEFIQLATELEKFEETTLQTIAEKLKVLGGKDVNLEEKSTAHKEIVANFKSYKEQLLENKLQAIRISTCQHGSITRNL